jgi:hypothetical protein
MSSRLYRYPDLMNFDFEFFDEETVVPRKLEYSRNSDPAFDRMFSLPAIIYPRW